MHPCFHVPPPPPSLNPLQLLATRMWPRTVWTRRYRSVIAYREFNAATPLRSISPPWVCPTQLPRLCFRGVTMQPAGGTVGGRGRPARQSNSA
uniref:Uncharacterized protein n=1 Tax=Triticum urartu TaxID=4572 RepID=A0A8R7THJ1_TRIUA